MLLRTISECDYVTANSILMTRISVYSKVFLYPRHFNAVERTRHDCGGNSDIIYKQYGNAILQKNVLRLQFYQNYNRKLIIEKKRFEFFDMTYLIREQFQMATV